MSNNFIVISKVSNFSVLEGENKIVEYYQTFNLTSYDATNTIILHIFTNTGEEITVELEKNT